MMRASSSRDRRTCGWTTRRLYACRESGFSGWAPSRGAVPDVAWVAAGSRDVVVVRLVGGTASGVPGFWFGVWGSWSRMRHQRAAAGWSSGRGPAAAAERTSRVASKPALVRLHHQHLGLPPRQTSCWPAESAARCVTASRAASGSTTAVRRRASAAITADHCRCLRDDRPRGHRCLLTLTGGVVHSFGFDSTGWRALWLDVLSRPANGSVGWRHVE